MCIYNVYIIYNTLCIYNLYIMPPLYKVEPETWRILLEGLSGRKSLSQELGKRLRGGWLRSRRQTSALSPPQLLTPTWGGATWGSVIIAWPRSSGQKPSFRPHKGEPWSLTQFPRPEPVHITRNHMVEGGSWSYWGTIHNNAVHI